MPEANLWILFHLMPTNNTIRHKQRNIHTNCLHLCLIWNVCLCNVITVLSFETYFQSWIVLPFSKPQTKCWERNQEKLSYTKMVHYRIIIRILQVLYANTKLTYLNHRFDKSQKPYKLHFSVKDVQNMKSHVGYSFTSHIFFPCRVVH